MLSGCLGGGTDPIQDDPVPAAEWSDDVLLVSAYGRVAVGNRVHVVGHDGGMLVHLSSQNDGQTWSAPTVIAGASGNYPMQYGGLYAVGDTVYLLTATGDPGPSSRPLDFRKSVDNGATWSSPVRVTGAGEDIRRGNIAASGSTVHVFGGRTGAGGYGTGIFYFRSTDGGATWEDGVLLYAEADASARMAVDGSTVHVAFGVKSSPDDFGGRTHYMRSVDGGTTWSTPVPVGDGDRDARQQIAAADGRIVIMWQREPAAVGQPLPADRLGFATSGDNGSSWSSPRLLPDDSGVNREHHQIWMVPGGGLHVAWSHGPPTNPASPAGYKYSPDYGNTWGPTEFAISTLDGGNLPHGIAADSDWVHLITEPGAGVYARRPVP